MIRDAATIVLAREYAGKVQVFMVRRGKTAQFMPKAMVFPGGRLDDADCSDAVASRCTMTREAAAKLLGMDDGKRALGLLVAGVRETFEEAGVLLASPVDPSDKASTLRLTAARKAINNKKLTFEAMLRREDLDVDVHRVAYFARWITPPIERRRFDARFFVAVAPSGQTAYHDDTENTASAWLNPSKALMQYAEGKIQLAPPTLRVLMGLAKCADIDAVLAARGESLQEAYLPQAQQDGTELHLLMPGDTGYNPPGKGENRVVLQDGHWHSMGEGF